MSQRERYSKGFLGLAGGPASWLGLAWVYSGALWLFGIVIAAALGLPMAALFLLVRLATTLAVGIGLCALERWAWAAVVSAGAFYALFGALAAGVAGASLATLPGNHLSWMPVLYGLKVGDVVRLGIGGTAACCLSVTALTVLWRTREQFDIPYRKTYTVLLQAGLAPALLLVVTDAYLVYGWWALAGHR